MISKVVASIATVNIALCLGLLLSSCATAADDEADTYLDEARQARDAEQIDRAKTYAQMAVDEGRREGEAHKILADVSRLRAIRLTDKQDHLGAYEAYLEAAEYEPVRSRRGEDLVDAYAAGQRAGRPTDELFAVAVEALADMPNDADLRRDIARMAEDAGDESTAVEHYLWIFSAHPDDTRSGLRLGILYLGLERPGDAASVLGRVYDQEPENVQAALNLAAAYGQLRRYDDAVTIFEHLLERHPNHPGILRRYADFERQRGNQRKARQLQQRAGDAAPGIEKREMRPLR